VSRAEGALIASMLDSSGLSREAWEHKELPHSAVPAELVLHDAGLLFWPQGLSEHGCSPTKVGEYWACGVPVVSTPNISDTDALVRTNRVGVIVDPKDSRSVEAAAVHLLELLGDPGLPLRCRRTAEAAYSLEGACLIQARLYRDLSR
jgi:glycosyltransferase involved in cell wall biosynthesis